MKWLIARWKEPSTKAGLSALALIAGLPPGTIDLVFQIVGGGLAIAAMFSEEKGASGA